MPRLHRRHHAPVALAVQMLDGELIGAELVGALVGIGAGLRHVEAEGHRRAVAGVVAEVGAESVAHEERRDRDGAAKGGTALQHRTAIKATGELDHRFPPICFSWVPRRTFPADVARGKRAGVP